MVKECRLLLDAGVELIGAVRRPFTDHKPFDTQGTEAKESEALKDFSRLKKLKKAEKPMKKKVRKQNRQYAKAKAKS